MAIFCVTGSTDGIGRAAATRLVTAGHHVLLHARSAERGADVLAGLGELARGSGGEVHLVTGDLSSLEQVRALAEQVRRRGPLAALVHNAGVWVRGQVPASSADGYETTFAVNVLAPHLLTSLLAGSLDDAGARVVWLGSGMARSGAKHLQAARLQEIATAATRSDQDAKRAYATSKAADVALALGWGTRLRRATSAALDPGWVPTKLASAGASGSVDVPGEALAWLASQAPAQTLASSPYVKGHQGTSVPGPLRERELQDALMGTCDRLAGVA